MDMPNSSFPRDRIDTDEQDDAMSLFLSSTAESIIIKKGQICDISKFQQLLFINKHH